MWRSRRSPHSVIESYATDDPIQLEILKTVGLLNLLNDDLLATTESVRCALADADSARQKQVRSAVDKLNRTKRVLYDRGRSGGLCLWPHTSDDIEQAYEDARRAVQTPRRVAPLIKDHLETRPVVARRHYIETGNLRHYEVRYCPVAGLPALLDAPVPDADGLIVVPLCESVDERRAALAFAQADPLRDRLNWLIAVPQPLNNLAPLIEEVQRWEWVADNTPQLNADKYGREEVSTRLRAAQGQLEHRVLSLVGFKQYGEPTELSWFHQGAPLVVREGRHLLSALSRILDETYSQAPRIHNELVNRRNLSSAAGAARMRLIEGMFTHASAALLGMNPQKKPPEMSMYLSVLLHTGIHRQQGDTWRIGEPSPDEDIQCHVLPTLRKIREILEGEADARINVSVLSKQLREPPFGVRNGMIPVLLTAFAIAHEQYVAFYKDGTFLRELTAEAMLVLTKQPERFEIQLCRIEGVRADLFERLLTVIEDQPSARRGPQLLDVVKPLCVFVARLPEYVHHTKKLSAVAVACRDAILGARDPARLLFSDLPKACGSQVSQLVSAYVGGSPDSAADEDWLRQVESKCKGALQTRSFTWRCWRKCCGGG